jgi:hypothetical protein
MKAHQYRKRGGTIMNYKTLFKLLAIILCFIAIVSLQACKTVGVQVNLPSVSGEYAKPGPPAHAKAYGYRAKHLYRFYPEAAVYFDISSKSYFYLCGNKWTVSLTLPQALRVKLGDCVTIEMDTDKPYTKFKEHRIKYPPGQLKKKKKKKKWTKKYY